MAKEICISSTPHETRLAILEDDQLAEIYYERENEYTLAGSIYNGRVTRVLPGMQSAFVDVGLERDAFLYVTDFLELEDAEETDEIEKAAASGGAQPPREVRHSPAPDGTNGRGDARQRRTIIPCTASARLSVRVALGQSGSEIAGALERILRAAAPAGAQIELEVEPGEPAGFDTSDPVLALARAAIAEATGMQPLYVRSGGSIPILGAFAQRGIPTVLSGFSLDADGLHGPDESYRLESLALGERAARELYAAFATLRPA